MIALFSKSLLPLAVLLLVALLGPNTVMAQTAAPTTNATAMTNSSLLCGGEICDKPDYYCYKELTSTTNITECIPETFGCGSRACPNRPGSFCDISSGTCQEAKFVCEGVTTKEQMCGDTTSWVRWTLAGDKSTITTATACGLDCSPPDTSGTPSAAPNHYGDNNRNMLFRTLGVVAAVGAAILV